METKTVNRNIPEKRENQNDRFRVNYGDRRNFKLLSVNVTRIKTGETQTFTFKASRLPDRDSIHFSTAVINNKLKVRWIGINPDKGALAKDPVNKINLPPVKEKKKNPEKKKAILPGPIIKSGFAPIVFPDSTILILGTMPGEQSLAKQEYYAHPRNLIWKIIASLVKEPIPLTYNEKKTLLKKAHIALWDVCDVCVREGSLDTGITNEIPNDLIGFLKKYKEIKTIGFNGGKAEALFDKYFTRDPRITYLSLPSSSPANAGISWEKKLNAWSKII